MSPIARKLLPVAILAALGVGVSVVIEGVHQRLAADLTYASFCNVSARVNCDAVLTSPYARFFGVPLSRWGILFYSALAGGTLAIGLARQASLRHMLAGGVLAAAVWSLLFSAYLATVSVVVLGHLCLLCSALYLVNIGLCVATGYLYGAVRVARRRQTAPRASRARWVFASGLLAAVALVSAGTWQVFGTPASHTDDPNEIQRQRPEFYRWYLSQPVLSLPAADGNAAGPATARVTVVEFSDFQCGHCAKFHSSLETVLRRFRGEVRVVFRHFPLNADCNPRLSSRLHAEACAAAVAAECAAEQGQFWPYHTLLFEHQRALDRAFYIAAATRIGLDTARFTACLDSEAARERVRRDAQLGTDLGIDSTPTVFINGRRIKGALDPTRLADALALARTNQ